MSLAAAKEDHRMTHESAAAIEDLVKAVEAAAEREIARLRR